MHARSPPRRGSETFVLLFKSDAHMIPVEMLDTGLPYRADVLRGNLIDLPIHGRCPPTTAVGGHPKLNDAPVNRSVETGPLIATNLSSRVRPDRQLDR